MTNESGYLETNGARIYYEVEGDGSPLLLIHGGLGSLRMWDGVVPALTDRYRVIRYDTRGFGQTETEDVEFSNRADAIAVLDHLEAASAVVVGQSRGGNIALDLAIEHPQRVTALVSVAGGVGGHQGEFPRGPRNRRGTRSNAWRRRAIGILSPSSRPGSGSMAGGSR